MKISIVILTYNKLDYTKLCIESIRKYTEPNTYEIIVVDNLSTDGTRDWLVKQQDVISILNDSNMGFPKGCNQGIEVASGDHILLLNNDTIVTENWLNNMVSCLTSDETIGAVSCVTNNCSYAQAIPVSYHNLDEMQLFSRDFNKQNPELWEERLKLVGFCFLVKKDVIDKIGLLDERFTPGNFEDDDYSLRIRKAGFKLILCKDTFIHHFGSTSFKENAGSYNILLKNNARKYEEKWGINPNHSQHIHFDIISLIDNSHGDKINVLEVGCGSGGTLLQIKNQYKNSQLFGIEQNPNAASVASIIANVQSINIENESLAYPESFFDYIIFADTLQQYQDPWRVLTNVNKHLKTSGKMLVSIPNVMHHSVIKGLLNGYWSYEEHGAFDKGDLRFFTFHEINKIFLESGFINLQFTGTTLQTTVEDSEFLEKLSSLAKPELIQQFNIKNYLLSATKSELFEMLRYVTPNKENPQAIVDKLSKYSNQEIINCIMYSKEIDKVELLNYIGVIHFEIGDYERVLPFFENAYSLEKSNKDVLYNLSYFLLFIGEEEKANNIMVSLNKVNPIAYKELLGVAADFKVKISN